MLLGAGHSLCGLLLLTPVIYRTHKEPTMNKIKIQSLKKKSDHMEEIRDSEITTRESVEREQTGKNRLVQVN